MKALDFKLKILVLSWKKEKKDKTMLIEDIAITLKVNPSMRVLYTLLSSYHRIGASVFSKRLLKFEL